MTGLFFVNHLSILINKILYAIEKVTTKKYYYLLRKMIIDLITFHNLIKRKQISHPD